MKGTLGTGTYSVSADGKTLSFNGAEEGTAQFTIKSLTATSLVLYEESEGEMQEEYPDGTHGPVETYIVKKEMTFKKVN